MEMHSFIRKVADRAIKAGLIIVGLALPTLASFLMFAAYAALMEEAYGRRFDADADVFWFVIFAATAFAGYVALVVPRIWLKSFVAHAPKPTRRVPAVQEPEPDENREAIEWCARLQMQAAMIELFGVDPVGEATKEFQDWLWQERVKRIPRPRSYRGTHGENRLSTLREGFLSPVLEGQRSEHKPIVPSGTQTTRPIRTDNRELLARTVSDDGTVLEVYNETIDDTELAAIIVAEAA